MKAKVKICGLTDPVAAEWAAECGAAALGLVFYAASPRAVQLDKAAEIFEFVPARIQRVGLFVDAGDDDIARALDHVRLDFLQLHGQESVERVEAVRLEFGMPVIKAIGVRDAADLDAARAYDGVADLLLFDAKPSADASRPGGLGQPFDWSLLKGRTWSSPWYLAGGLTPCNVAAAIAAAGARLVDVSTGVESAPGVKDPALVEAFIAAARGTAHA